MPISDQTRDTVAKNILYPSILVNTYFVNAKLIPRIPIPRNANDMQTFLL